MIREVVQMFAESAEFSADRVNYTDCPECGHHNKLMVITTSDGLFFRCLRASCPTLGHLGGGPRVTQHKPGRRVAAVLSTTALTDDQREFIEQRVPGLGSTLMDLVRAHGDSFVYSLYSPTGALRGVIQRWYDGRTPKTKTHAYVADGPMIGWLFGSDRSTARRRSLVVVEDVPSALAVYYWLDPYAVVALSGTSLSAEAAREMRACNPDQTLLCLDADATETAQAMRRAWGGVIGGDVRVVPLTQDLKDMAPGQLQQWWSDIR